MFVIPPSAGSSDNWWRKDRWLAKIENFILPLGPRPNQVERDDHTSRHARASVLAPLRVEAQLTATPCMRTGKIKFWSVLGPKWLVSIIVCTIRQLNAPKCPTFQLISTCVLSTGTISSPGQAWSSPVNANLPEFTHFSTQVQLSHTCSNALEPVFPACAYSPAHTMV